MRLKTDFPATNTSVKQFACLSFFPFKKLALLLYFHVIMVFAFTAKSQTGNLSESPTLINDRPFVSAISINSAYFNPGVISSFFTYSDLLFLPIENTGDASGYFLSFATAGNNYPEYFNNIIVRGFKSSKRRSQIAMLADGYRIDRAAFSSLPLSIVPLLAVGRIEAKCGNAASRYGGNAMGGLINMGDRRKDGYFTRAAVSYGSFDSYNIGFVHGAGSGSAKYKIYAANQSTDGFRDNGASQSYNFGGSIQIPVSRKAVVFFNSVNHILKSDMPGFIAGLQSDEKKYSSPVFSYDRSENEYYIANVGFRNRFKRTSLMEVKLGFQHININENNTYAGLPPVVIGTTPGNFTVTDSYGSDFYGNTKNARLSGNNYDLLFTLKNESPEGLGMIEGGIEADYGAYQKSVYDIFEGFEDDYAENFQDRDSLEWTGDGYIFKTGVFVNGELLPATPLKVQAGLRYDFSTDHFIGRQPDTVLNRQFAAVTPRLGLLLSTGFAENYSGNIYAGYYHAFAFPAPDERVNFTQYRYAGYEKAGPSLFPIEFETPVASDANFKNQRSRTFEIGTFQKFKLKNELLAEVELTGFLTEVDNRIIFDHQVGRYVQIEESETTGLEIAARLNYKNVWSGFFNYAFADAKILSGQTQRKVIPGIAKNVVSTAVIFNHPSGIFATVAMQRKGKIFPDNANEQELKGYFVFNARAGYTFRFITIYFDVLNLFDNEHYSDGFSRNEVTYYYPAAGRRINAGLRISL
jgi:outer membrane receptor protein involved in Fe transport